MERRLPRVARQRRQKPSERRLPRYPTTARSPQQDAATWPEAIADRLQIKGRGGTVLQPAIDLLESATDFPDDGPLLIITDGYCDRLHIRREHAFLLPEGHHLPFAPRGEVFRIR